MVGAGHYSLVSEHDWLLSQESSVSIIPCMSLWFCLGHLFVVLTYGGSCKIAKMINVGKIDRAMSRGCVRIMVDPMTLKVDVWYLREWVEIVRW